MDIIHTDEKFGLQITIGHMDFWPNGGKQQPGRLFNIEAIKFIVLTEINNQLGCSIIQLLNIVFSALVACSLNRARDLFKYSIVSSDYFTSSNTCANYGKVNPS